MFIKITISEFSELKITKNCLWVPKPMSKAQLEYKMSRIMVLNFKVWNNWHM